MFNAFFTKLKSLDSFYKRETPDPIPNSNSEPVYSQFVLFDTGEMVAVKNSKSLTQALFAITSQACDHVDTRAFIFCIVLFVFKKAQSKLVHHFCKLSMKKSINKKQNNKQTVFTSRIYSCSFKSIAFENSTIQKKSSGHKLGLWIPGAQASLACYGSRFFCIAQPSPVDAQAKLVHEPGLFSIDQIKQGESPWSVLYETPISIKSIKKPDQIHNKNVAHKSKTLASHSFFKKNLQERAKIRILYGNLSSKVLDRYILENKKSEPLIIALESRVDVLLKRASFFTSIQSARQSILHGYICVNGQRVYSPSYQCKQGDLIQVIQKKGLRGSGIKICNKKTRFLSFLPSELTARQEQKRQDQKPIRPFEKTKSKEFTVSNFKSELQILLQYLFYWMQKQSFCIISTRHLDSFKSLPFQTDSSDHVHTYTKKTCFLYSGVFCTYKLQEQTFCKPFMWLYNFFLYRYNKASLWKSTLSNFTSNKTQEIVSGLYECKSRQERTKRWPLQRKAELLLTSYQKMSQPKLVGTRALPFALPHQKIIFFQKPTKGLSLYAPDRKTTFFKNTESISHLEISHRNLSIFFLFPPQRVRLPLLIDLHFLF